MKKFSIIKFLGATLFVASGFVLVSASTTPKYLQGVFSNEKRGVKSVRLIARADSNFFLDNRSKKFFDLVDGYHSSDIYDEVDRKYWLRYEYLIWRDPLFRRLSDYEKDNFTEIVKGGGFDERIQRMALEERFFPTIPTTRGAFSYLRKALLWIIKAFNRHAGAKLALAALETIDNIAGGYAKKILEDILVKYLWFNSTIAHWVVELAFFAVFFF